MTNGFTTPQLDIWRGEFGTAYIDRNAAEPARLAALTAHWARILKTTEGAPPQRILEVGANIGLNLRALSRLTTAEFHAVEPNARARQTLVRDGVVAAERVHDAVASSLGLADGAWQSVRCALSTAKFVECTIAIACSAAEAARAATSRISASSLPA